MEELWCWKWQKLLQKVISEVSEGGKSKKVEMIEEFGHRINPESQEDDKTLSEEIFWETT